MSLFLSRPFLKFGVGCASALLFVTGNLIAQDETITKPLLGYSSNGLIAPDYDFAYGDLLDVTLTLEFAGKLVTIFNSDQPSSDLINVTLALNTGNESGNTLGAWTEAGGHVNFTYSELPGPPKTSAMDASIDAYLAGLDPLAASRAIEVNFLYLPAGGNGGSNGETGGNGNGGNGSGNTTGSPGGSGGTAPPTVPEPAGEYLAGLAAGLMAFLLAARGVQSRRTTRRPSA